jgi:hypothetical protein
MIWSVPNLTNRSSQKTSKNWRKHLSWHTPRCRILTEYGKNYHVRSQIETFEVPSKTITIQMPPCSIQSPYHSTWQTSQQQIKAFSWAEWFAECLIQLNAWLILSSVRTTTNSCPKGQNEIHLARSKKLQKLYSSFAAESTI